MSIVPASRVSTHSHRLKEILGLESEPVAAYQPLANRRGATQPSVGPVAQKANVSLPQLADDIVIKLSPEDVINVFRAVMDADREEAFSLVRDRVYREIRAVLDRPHCAPVFEMERKIREGG